MKITIKNLKHSEFASQETHCFEATLYINGKRFCKVSNQGTGGPDSYHPIDGSNPNEFSKEIGKIQDELSKEIIQMGSYEIPNNLEIVVGDLVNDALAEKSIKKTLKRICFVDKDCGPKEFKQFGKKVNPTEANLKRIKKLDWWTNDHILLNELPMEEVKKYL